MAYKDQFEAALNTKLTLKQVLFTRYFTNTLVDLVVLGLFNEFWSKIEINSFLTAMFSALLLQVLLQVSIILEHRSSEYFQAKGGPFTKAMRFVSAWGILFISKLIILWSIGVLFGENFLFHGRYHGVFPFLVLVITILVAESLIRTFYRYLGNSNQTE